MTTGNQMTSKMLMRRVRRKTMNDFEKQIAGISGDGLYSQKIETLQVNLGLQCNQQCTHCHLEA
jgi:hypothetical protein